MYLPFKNTTIKYIHPIILFSISNNFHPLNLFIVNTPATKINKKAAGKVIVSPDTDLTSKTKTDKDNAHKLKGSSKARESNNPFKKKHPRINGPRKQLTDIVINEDHISPVDAGLVRTLQSTFHGRMR
jgi:hypothetical protein